jgi:polyhydroxyalkanoate synthase
VSLPVSHVPTDLGAALTNLADIVRGRPLADLRATPRTLIKSSALGDLFRYDPLPGTDQVGKPILFIPPLAAPSLAFDLRRGNSVVEYFVGQGRPVYLVDYGPVNFTHRALGIEHWVDEVLPWAIQRVSEDAGGTDLHIAGWSLGGIFTMFVTAAHPELPIASATAGASPFDLHAVPLLAVARPFHNAGLRIIGPTVQLLGGVPASLTRLGFQLSAIDKYLTKPIAMLTHADDRDFLAQLEGVDRFMSNMYAYPGRTFGQLYHVVMKSNEFASGTLQLAGRQIDLGSITVPVLAVVGLNDTLAPLPATSRLLDLVPSSFQSELVEAPGGHLGVLTGRAAKRTSWPAMQSFYRDHDES